MLVPPARRGALQRRLLAWYDAGHRELPWRFPQRAADPYRVWLAEVMLQQTQVATALPYYERFVSRFPTLAALAAARDEDVLALWAGLGYYARCRNLLAAARTAMSRHGGLPADLRALRALPGFGPYTTGAVASIAFAIPAPAVDGNVARVLARLFLVDGDPARKRVRDRLDALAAALVAPARPGDLNQALMELGATVCGKPAPACARCPVAAACEARRAGREREIPPARRRPERRPLAVACALVEHRGRVLVSRAPAGALFGGLWGLPSVALPAGGDGDASGALVGGLRAALGLGVRVGPELASVRRILTHRTLTLVAYRCRLEAPIRASPALAWADGAALEARPVSTAMRALLEAVGVRGGQKTAPPGARRAAR